jgi:hypothetical protein
MSLSITVITMFRKSVALLIGLGMIVLLTACSSTSSKSGSGTTKPSIALSTTPTSLTVNGTLAITATVTNNSGNSGVTWSCAPATTCGAFSATKTASGSATTYQAPGTVPSSAVVITATLAGDTSITASTPAITITTGAAIAVTLSTTPTSLPINGTLPITATVTNDSSNGGVTWSCTPAATCGSFSATKTASGTATTYTAPGTVPSGTVVITATAVDNTSISASTPAITIAPTSLTVILSTAPPAALAPKGSATIAATVTNDSANKGVTWSCTPASTCGSFNPTSTASKATTVYTASATTGNVVIKATSVSNNTVSASSTVTITSAAGATLAPGNYVFWLAGSDSNTYSGVEGVNYVVAGAFTVTSGGVISGGEQDFSDFYNEVHDTGLTGTITSSSNSGDGNLTITLQTGDPCIGPGVTDINPCTGGSGQEILDATLVTSSKGLLIEDDTWASSSGTLDLQSTTLAIPTGAYAFVVNGVDISNDPIAIGGVINVNNSPIAGDISGAGSIFDVNDDATTLSADQLFTPSTVSSPDSFGFVNFNLDSILLPGNGLGGPGIDLVGYIVDSTHIRLVENWSNDELEGTTGGTALGQTGAGNFSGSSIAGSSYVLGSGGYDANGPLQVAGVLTFNSDGSVTGNLSFNDIATQSPEGGSTLAAEVSATPCSSGTAVTPCYTIDATGTGNDGGTGRVTITNLTDSTSSPTFLYNLELYLTGGGNAFAISMDTTDVLGGLGYQQTGTFSAASFAGSYVLNIDQQDTAGGFEYDGVGATAANGLGNLTGYLDLNGTLSSDLTPSPDDSLTGTFTANTKGVFTASIQGISSRSATTQDAFTIYLVDPTKAVAIENDMGQLTLGLFELQQ